jgi:hypothetical protein
MYSLVADANLIALYVSNLNIIPAEYLSKISLTPLLQLTVPFGS